MTSAAIRLRPENPRLRCASLTVLEEVPSWLVMGPHGELVAQVIVQARELTDEQARAIAAMDSVDERLVRAMWDRWLPGHRSGSSVGCGLSALHAAVTEAAHRTGSHLFGWDEMGGVEVLADDSWQQAAVGRGRAGPWGRPRSSVPRTTGRWRGVGRVRCARSDRNLTRQACPPHLTVLTL
jgi:hypothetical protein